VIIGLIIIRCSPLATSYSCDRVRNQMCAARVPVEGSKGEWGCGQHEVNFVHDQPLPMADMHILFKQGMKEIAAQQGKSVTFMAKPWAAEVGSSCHIHISLWRGRKKSFLGREQTRSRQQTAGGRLEAFPAVFRRADEIFA